MADLVVPEIRTLCNSIMELLIRMKMKAVYQLRFQAVIVALHWFVVIRTTSAAHVLLNAMLFAAADKVHRRELTDRPE